MNFKSILLTCTILTLLSWSAQADKIMDNPVIENMMTRTSVRKFKNQPVEKEKLDVLLHAAMAAPSAMNKQPWHFVVVTNPNILENINQYHSPLSIVVCMDTTKAVQMGKEWIICDGSLASENILLAAHALGLGGIWTAVFPVPDIMQRISIAVALPDNMIPLNVIQIGYTDGEVKPKDKWNPGNISNNKFGRKN
jgi:nitroreductase